VRGRHEGRGHRHDAFAGAAIFNKGSERGASITHAPRTYRGPYLASSTGILALSVIVPFPLLYPTAHPPIFKPRPTIAGLLLFPVGGRRSGAAGLRGRR